MFDVSMERPRSLPELWDAIEATGGKYRLLAGGTDLVVAARMGHHLGTTWIDISRIPDLGDLEVRSDHLWIGSTVTWQRLYRSELARTYLPGFLPCAFAFGSPQIRALGTIGGNVSHASPAGDSIPVMMIYDAEVVLTSRSGERTLPLTRFMTGVRKTGIQPGEVVRGLRLPIPAPHEARFFKLGPRESLSISKVNAAVRARRVDGKLSDVRIAIGAAAPVVYRAEDAERMLTGTWPDAEAIGKAARAAQAKATPITDLRSTKEYRFAMVEVLVRRGLEEIVAALASA